MKIRIGVMQRQFGYMDIEVPDGSVILDKKASARKKKLAARELGVHTMCHDTNAVIWDPKIDTEVDLGYIPLD